MKRHHYRIIAVVLVFVLMTTLMAGCSNATAESPSMASYWPTNGWKSSTPESQGMDSGKIDEMFKCVTKSGLDIHSILIIRNGYMVTEGYFYPYKKEYRHIMNSVTKSITSGVVGLAINDGYIKDIDQKVVGIFPDMKIANLDINKENMAIKNLLTMTAGLEWTENGAYGSAKDSNTDMWRSPNQLQYVLDRPMKEEPGKSFYYNSGASHILSAIIKKNSGKSSFDYAKEKIFSPLGISDVVWGSDKQGISSGSGRIFMRPDDLAKYGYLYLNNGKWDGKQIISQQWIKESTEKQVDTPDGLAGRHGYGYQWWQNSFGGYSARGFGGQYLFVIPEHNIVAVFTSGLHPTSFYAPEQLIKKYILPAAKSPKAIKENPSSFETLQKTVENINKAPAPTNVPKLSQTASRISGKTFKLDNGESYCFEFKEGSECVMNWFSDGVMYNTKVGLDGIYRTNDMDAFYWPGMTTKAGLRGSWTDDNTFAIDLTPYEDCNTYRMEFKFDGDTLHAKMISKLNGNTVNQGSGTVK